MKRILIVLSLIAPAACKQEATPTEEPARVQAIIDSLQFRRHSGLPMLCFGYSYVEQGFGDGRTGGPILVQVDCAAVNDRLPPEQQSPPAAERAAP